MWKPRPREAAHSPLAPLKCCRLTPRLGSERSATMFPVQRTPLTSLVGQNCAPTMMAATERRGKARQAGGSDGPAEAPTPCPLVTHRSSAQPPRASPLWRHSRAALRLEAAQVGCAATHHSEAGLDVHVRHEALQSALADGDVVHRHILGDGEACGGGRAPRGRGGLGGRGDRSGCGGCRRQAPCCACRDWSLAGSIDPGIAPDRAGCGCICSRAPRARLPANRAVASRNTPKALMIGFNRCLMLVFVV